MTGSDDCFSPEFKPAPYWWDASPQEADTSGALPSTADVVVIGAGYTGLHAAVQTARAGLETVVVDAEAAGFGCSTRNGGQISTSVKPSFSTLRKRYGEALAVSILKEGQASLDHVTGFVSEEQIPCDFGVVGRFHGAHTAGQYDKLARDCDVRNPGFDTGAFMVPRDKQHLELGTDAYHGGIVFPRHASLDPGKYHAGLLDVARSAGATIISHCRVNDLARSAKGFEVSTGKGRIRANKVIIATNGYTGPLTPWQQRRVIPIGSYVIATEEIPAETMDRLFPTNRILSDTRKLVYYYRPSPDRKRILFGGRVSLQETDPRKSGPKLLAELVRLFPELAQIRISHSWAGIVAFTFDTLMHCGEDAGLYYAMGYCGSGVGMAGYLGSRVGRAAAGVDSDLGAFSRIPFETRPFYTGRPWFLGPSVAVYRLRDRLGI
ncbi:MAG: FAD-binding oxidoreductase [Hoeflea sp.]|uniref:NAD(P)/FAD-dependent oxidoreductase n=1 Tax=Hoeflea sp. TaxID=1940281 RepID=UPI001DCE7441|nr:FAD-binding oxidoreductase [Hoeflea sp.]MBU4528111.1 FAD-binding oxidoreductase [Alphaproteobacteria bacterium]MBU4543707.1 FAD-binding oxidoreductase [Alphaproteobacteria bacterium]MBU4548574.1 FAD-binding oxidoreductase [Alphaproteobacteria bacterium]MBV1725740.1 FAD-binding oxidoreductase [Hoeflea sp.]MBV1762096.1 FAD-binding oxidoreductase [Hoeflea sp.]